MCFETPMTLAQPSFPMVDHLQVESTIPNKPLSTVHVVQTQISCARKHELSQFPGDLGVQIGLPPDLAPGLPQKGIAETAGLCQGQPIKIGFPPSNLKSWKCASISLPTVAVDGRWSTDRHNSNQIKRRNIKPSKTPEDIQAFQPTSSRNILPDCWCK